MSEYKPGSLDLLLHDALSRSATEPPPDLAQATSRLAADAPERAAMEILAVRVLLGLGALAAGAYAVTCFDAVASHVGHIFERAPWPLLLTSAVLIGVIQLAEIVRLRRKRYSC